MVTRVGKKKPKAASSGFRYKARSTEQVKKRIEQSGGRFDSPFKQGTNVLRLESGESQLRILPPTWEDFEHYGLDVWMHRFIGADNSNYLCLNKMLGKKCPACEEAKALKAAGEDEDMKKMQAQKRTLVYVIDRDDENDPPLPQVWDMSWNQDREISSLTHTKHTGKILLLDHPDDGYDLTVKKTGKQLRTKYQYIIDRESSRICDDPAEQEEILSYIMENPLTDILRYDTAAHIEKQLAGSSEEKDEDLDEDEEETPKKKKKRPAAEEDDEEEIPRKRKRAPVEEEDEDEEEVEEIKPKKKKRPEPDEEEEEEEEEEEPAPKKKKRAPVEEEEEDEEEEEPAPKKKKRAPVEEEEEDEEEEEAPAPKKKKKRPVEEEDEEEEEEEEEPAPRKRRRS